MAELKPCILRKDMITTQIVFFHTLNTPGFEHVSRSNNPNWPSWHIKDLVMLLIKFYSSFCSFHKLYILKMGMQLEHEKINWNSELQNQKVEPQKQKTKNNFARVEISQPYEISYHLFLIFFSLF